MTRGRRLLLGFTLVLSLLWCTREARAGITNERIDWFYITPFVGAEVARLAIADLRLIPTNQTGIRDVNAGLAYGAWAGMRFGPISFGIDFQRTDFLGADPAAFATNKIYGQLGINAQIGRWVVVTHFDFGYAVLTGGGLEAVSGFGGKIGLAFDGYLSRLVSIGFDVAFDGAGYSGANSLVGSLGGSFLGRVGFHL